MLHRVEAFIKSLGYLNAQIAFAKMEPLKTSKWLLTCMCIYPAAKATSRMKRLAYVMFAGLVIFGQFSGTFPHLAFFLINQSTDLEGSLSAFMGFTTFMAVDYIILSFYVQQEQVTNIFHHLSTIYDSRKYCTVLNTLRIS